MSQVVVHPMYCIAEYCSVPCWRTCPDIFDHDSQNVVVLKKQPASPSEVDCVKTAIQSCPGQDSHGAPAKAITMS